jgi:hypothetical protein
MKINYSYRNWGIIFSTSDNVIRVICNIEDDNKDRYYSVLGEVTKVEMIGEYVYIYVKSERIGDRLYQLKFEGESGLVGDIFSFDGEDHIDTFACYDFIEDDEVLGCEEIN